MREIEIKARVKDEKSLRTKLMASGVSLSAPAKQRDKVYSTPNVTVGQPKIYLRIRTENDKKHMFTLKHSVTSQLDSIEHETEFSDVKEMTAIINVLGYVPYSEITKNRQKAKIGSIEICLDKVEALGVFIEAESMCEQDVNATNVMAEMWVLLESFGVSKKDEVLEGYDVLAKRLQTAKG